MSRSTLERLAAVPDPGPCSGAPIAGPLTLRRAWARGPDALALEYTDAGGRLVAGQWRRPREEIDRLLKRFRRAQIDARLAHASGGEPVVLQAEGADADLPGLRSLLDRPGASLVSHRAGRRAVVRLEWAGQSAYAKALRSSRLGRVRSAHEHGARALGEGFSAARIVHADDAGSFLVFEALAGTPLHDMVRDDAQALAEALRGAGRALRSLHRSAPPLGLPSHRAGGEAEMLRERLRCADALASGPHAEAAEVAPGILARLADEQGGTHVVHRDLYDKQIIAGDDGTLALLDLDTLAIGEPAIDLGNMLAHLELHDMQGRCSTRTVRGAGAALLEGYGYDGFSCARVSAYRDATLLRLAMLYGLWPAWPELAPRLLERIGERFWDLPSPDRRARPRASGTGCSTAPASPAFFVVGCPRSGTTLMERMLDTHPDLSMTHETHWVTKHAKRGRGLDENGCVTDGLLDRLYDDHRFARMAPQREEARGMLDAGPLPYGSFVELIFEAWRTRHGARVVGDKSTGAYLRNLPRLLDVCPRARVVHLVRDGRDVCLSMLTWPKAGRAAGRFPMWREDPVATTAAWWRWQVGRCIEDGRRLGGDRYLELRYEALVARSAETCGVLCRFLGIPFDERMTRFHDGRTRQAPGLSANAAWLPPTPGLRDWRSQMSGERVELFEAIAGDLLGELGYERAFPDVSPRIAECAAARITQWREQVGDAGSPLRPSPRIVMNTISQGSH